MRFMVLVKATEESEAGVLPSKELLAAMGRYNEELVKAGVVLAGEGLQASSKGARVRFDGDKRTVTDGPFTETKEVIGGYAVLEAKSMQDAIELTKRFLRVHGDEWDIECEVRPLDGPEFGVQASR
jgi:hypothetical protein